MPRILASAIWFFYVAGGPALAAEGEAPPNAYAMAVEKYLVASKIYWTGVSRLSDVELIGFGSCLFLVTFAVSGLGIIFYGGRGLGYQTGALMALPATVASVLAYTVRHPYPGSADAPVMFLWGAIGGLIAVLIGGAVKVAARKGLDIADAPKPRVKVNKTDRLKLAVREGTRPVGGGR